MAWVVVSTVSKGVAHQAGTTLKAERSLVNACISALNACRRAAQDCCTRATCAAETQSKQGGCLFSYQGLPISAAAVWTTTIPGS
jgi:hypothetical protein